MSQNKMMSRSASKISSVKKDVASFKARRSVSADTRARGSYVPERKRPSSEERKSGNKLLTLRWGNTARKSSINLQENKRKDVRPLTDKAYQKRKVTQLVEFLDEAGFAPPITIPKLMAPSKKDFENIFQFLYRYFDPSYEVKKIEEEGPKILKNLNYPFTVNKSAFVYVARTNWPSLLGVLIWLMDLCKFIGKVDIKNVFETVGDDENAEKVLVRYICQCYHSRIDDEEAENEVFIKIIESKVLKDHDIIKSENEEKKQRLAAVEKQIKDLNSLAENNATLDNSIEKFEDYIQKMESHYKNKSEVCEKLMDELKLKESQLEILQHEVSQKQTAYDAQGFDGKKHLHFFEMQKRELAAKLDKKRTIVKDLHDKCDDAEIEYRKMSEKITAASEASQKLHDSLVESLKSVFEPLLNIRIPQVQKLHENIQLNFPVYEMHSGGRSIQSNTAFRDAWKGIAERIKNTDEILKRICSTLNQKLTEIEMKKSDVSAKLKLYSVEKSKQEQDLNIKKRIANDEISSLESQCEKIREVMASLQEEKYNLEKTYREMIEEKKALMEYREKKEKELKEYLIQQKEMFDYFSRTEREIMLEIQAHGNEIAQKLEELKDLEAPSNL